MIWALLVQIALAIEPTNPTTLCDRFIAPDVKKVCEKKLGKLGPDWYLASVCEKQFDDEAFYKCLEMSKNHNFSPTKLDPCADEGLSDKDRMSCLEKVAANSKSDFFQSGPAVQRLPASKARRKALQLDH